jgi:hypothetical protein
LNQFFAHICRTSPSSSHRFPITETLESVRIIQRQMLPRSPVGALSLQHTLKHAVEGLFDVAAGK